jgi:predicted lipoprotein with Yx(FWY)xxD motif
VVSDLNNFFSGTSTPPETCTGPENDLGAADWPAFTTTAKPVAGPGVDPRLLGSVYRADLNGYQVTYAGHPLYLFDPGPSSFFGENFVETVQPLLPWHTFWYLVSPNGTVDLGPANLVAEEPASGVLDPVTETTGATSYSSPALAVTMLPGEGGIPITVYTLHGPGPGPVHCIGACATEFIPLRTTGQPVAPGLPGRVGTVPLPDGTKQVTYNGQPLYMFNQEQPMFLFSSGPPYDPGNLIGLQSQGNGQGVSGFGGTLSVIAP